MIVYSTIAKCISCCLVYGRICRNSVGLLVMFLAGVKAKKCGYVAERRILQNDGYYVYDWIILYYVMGYGIYRFAGSDRKWNAFYYRKQICDFDFNEYYFVDRRNFMIRLRLF